MDTSPKVIVHCVHGTFPRGLLNQLAWNARFTLRWLTSFGRTQDCSDLYPVPHPDKDKRYWFEPESPFEQSVRRKIDGHEHQVSFERLLWSGNNSFSARFEAAEALRSHLAESRQRSPTAKHLIVAHSHGGTVAINAVDEQYADGRLTDGVMTLGTPFVRLVPRGKVGPDPDFKSVIAVFLPWMLLLMSPLIALDVVLRAGGSASALPGLVLLAVGLTTLVLRHVPLAATVLLIAFVHGDGVIRSDFLAAGVLAFAITIVLSHWWPNNPLMRMTATRFVQWNPSRLPCTLVAIRTPNDEASLVIGLAQILERSYHLIGRLITPVVHWLARPFGWFDHPGWGQRLMSGAVSVAYLMLLGIVLIVLNDWVRGIDGRAWWETLILSIGSPGLFLIPVGIAIMLLWVVPGLLMSIAAGREAFAIPAITGVDAEPLPFASPESAMQLVIDAAIDQTAPPAALSHSLHELDAIRTRVARWVSEFMQPQIEATSAASANGMPGEALTDTTPVSVQASAN